MRLDLPPAPPPRDLEECELVEAYGLTWLCLAVQVQAGVTRSTGEVRTRTKRTRYLLDRPAVGVVRLVTDRADPATGLPLAYHVTEHGCDCPDAQFKGIVRRCKHFEGLRAVGLLPVAAGRTNQSGKGNDHHRCSQPHK